MSDAVWVTGVGTVNPLAAGFGPTADALLAGRSGVRLVTEYPLADHACRVAGRVGPVPTPPGWADAEFARLDDLRRVVFWCVGSALADAGLWPVPGGRRVGLVLGVGAEWMCRWEADHFAGGRSLWERPAGERSVVAELKERLGLAGPATTVAAACASGNVALAQGRRWLRHGWADVVIAAGCDTMVTPHTLACFDNLRVLSRRAGDPSAASRPFDRGRDGFVPGEGGAAFVLEPETAARRRSARAYAELAGTGATSDAYHPIIPGPDPGPATRAVRAALAEAGVDASEVDYVNAHGTATPAGDAGEARVIRDVLGSAADRVPVSSTKSMTGHLLSAAAAVEAVACLAALARQAVPPTINLDEPDPACDLCHVPHHAREARVRVAVSNSFGFGGSNTCAVFRQVA